MCAHCRLFLMRVADIPYLNISGPDCKSEVSCLSCSLARSLSPSSPYGNTCLFQCSRSGTTFCTSPSLKSGKPVTCTSCSAPLVICSFSSMTTHPSLHLACLSIHQFLYPSVHPVAEPPFTPSTHSSTDIPFIHPPSCLLTPAPTCPSVHHSVHQHTHPDNHLSFCPVINPPTPLFIYSPTPPSISFLHSIQQSTTPSIFICYSVNPHNPPSTQLLPTTLSTIYPTPFSPKTGCLNYKHRSCWA